MKAIGKIGWILIIGLFTFAYWQPIGFAAVDLYRRDYYRGQRIETNAKGWPFRIPPGYVMEIGWFFAYAVSTTGWWFWMEAKADIDPEYDVVNVLVMLTHVLLKAFFYLVHTTRHHTGAAATACAAFAVSFVVLVLAGTLATWKFFWWWLIMPLWLLYVSLTSSGLAAHPIQPLKTAGDTSPAVGTGEVLDPTVEEPAEK